MELDGELALMIREQLHEHPKVIEANRIGERVLRDLADACLAEPRLALDWYWSRYQADRAAGSREARYHVIDYVAALTDDHALQRHHELFGTTFD